MPKEPYPERTARPSGWLLAIVPVAAVTVPMLLSMPRILQALGATLALAGVLTGLVTGIASRDSNMTSHRRSLLGQREAARDRARQGIGVWVLLGGLIALVAAGALRPDAITAAMESQIPQWSILLFAMTFIGWVAGFALICGLQYRQVERDVEDELRRGLHREDDPLLREPTLLDEWDAAPRRDRLSTIGLLAVWLLGVTVSWVGSRFDPPWNPFDAGLPLAVSVALWSTTLLIWGLPVYVMAYWQHRWAIRERRWLRSIRGQELLNYLNRNYRPRLSLTEWQTRTRPAGDSRVRYGVILGLGLVGVLMGGGLIYAFVGSFALSVEVGWILAPVWISLVLMLGAMSVVFGHSMARQALVYALLRSDGGGDTSAGPTGASSGSAPTA